MEWGILWFFVHLFLYTFFYFNWNFYEWCYSFCQITVLPQLWVFQHCTKWLSGQELDGSVGVTALFISAPVRASRKEYHKNARLPEKRMTSNFPAVCTRHRAGQQLTMKPRTFFFYVMAMPHLWDANFFFWKIEII